LDKENDVKIKIGAIDYDIRIVEDTLTSDNAGKISFVKSEIVIDEDCSPQDRQHVLWHEVIHGITVQAGHEVSEGLVECIAYGVMQVLRDNPEWPDLND